MRIGGGLSIFNMIQKYLFKRKENLKEKKIIKERILNNMMKKSIKEFSNDEIRLISKILSDEIPDDNEIEFMREEENYWGIDEEIIIIWNDILKKEEKRK